MDKSFSQPSDFITRNCEFISHNCETKSELRYKSRDCLFMFNPVSGWYMRELLQYRRSARVSVNEWRSTGNTSLCSEGGRRSVCLWSHCLETLNLHTDTTVQRVPFAQRHHSTAHASEKVFLTPAAPREKKLTRRETSSVSRSSGLFHTDKRWLTARDSHLKHRRLSGGVFVYSDREEDA